MTIDQKNMEKTLTQEESTERAALNAVANALFAVASKAAFATLAENKRLTREYIRLYGRTQGVPVPLQAGFASLFQSVLDTIEAAVAESAETPCLEVLEQRAAILGREAAPALFSSLLTGGAS